MHRYFATSPVFSPPSDGIDRDSGTIKGITIAQLGLAKGHAGYIDKTFLLQIVENAATRPAGIKARFGHPNMCSTSLGTYLGRFKNYSYTGDKVKADLYLDETARKTPGGDLYSYVFDMAEKNPDMFGASIVFTTGESEIIEEEVDNKKVKREYFRLSELMATDLVDSPAATDSLFSVKMGGVDAFPGIATRFLDENPELLEFIFSRPQAVTEFLSNYINNSKMNFSEKIKQNFAAFLEAFSPASQSENFVPDSIPLPNGEGQAGISESASISLEDHQFKISDIQSELHTRNTELEVLKSELKTRNQELETLTQELETLRQQLAARPSIPLNVTDPALSINSSSHPKDETGKQILAAMPKDFKRKLAAASKTTE